MIKHIVPQSKTVMSLTQWARTHAISYRTAWRMVRHGNLPPSVTSEQLPTGTIRIEEHEPANSEQEGASDDAIVYVRINPRQDRAELAACEQECRLFCCARGWVVSRIVRENAPAVGNHRAKLCRLLATPPRRLVIPHQSTLSRFDSRLIEQLLAQAGCELVIVNRAEEVEGAGGALEDLADAISITCRRHYGQKRGSLLVEALRKIVASGF